MTQDSEAESSTNPTAEEYIRERHDLLRLPLFCGVCESEVSYSSMVFLDDGEPLCEEHQEMATETVEVEHHSGYPNNGIGVDADEATSWLVITGRMERSRGLIQTVRRWLA